MFEVLASLLRVVVWQSIALVKPALIPPIDWSALTNLTRAPLFWSCSLFLLFPFFSPVPFFFRHPRDSGRFGQGFLDIPPVFVSVNHLGGVDGCELGKVHGFGII